MPFLYVNTGVRPSRKGTATSCLLASVRSAGMTAASYRNRVAGRKRVLQAVVQLIVEFFVECMRYRFAFGSLDRFFPGRVERGPPAINDVDPAIVAIFKFVVLLCHGSTFHWPTRAVPYGSIWHGIFGDGRNRCLGRLYQTSTTLPSCSVTRRFIRLARSWLWVAITADSPDCRTSASSASKT